LKNRKKNEEYSLKENLSFVVFNFSLYSFSMNEKDDEVIDLNENSEWFAFFTTERTLSQERSTALTHARVT
jgi:hypothetical protein